MQYCLTITCAANRERLGLCSPGHSVAFCRFQIFQRDARTSDAKAAIDSTVVGALEAATGDGFGFPVQAPVEAMNTPVAQLAGLALHDIAPAIEYVPVAHAACTSGQKLPLNASTQSC